MATIKKFNSENFNVKVVDAMNLNQGDWRWIIDLKVEVTDKETGVKVYDIVLKNRVVPMLDGSDDWYYFIENKIEEGAELDEDLDYYDADEELQKEFDEKFEEEYIEWLLFGEVDGGCGYKLDDEDLSEIFDYDDYNLVIIDGDNVWFTNSSKWDSIGYNVDTENEVYECDEYIIEELDWNEYELRDKNDIKIVEDLCDIAA